RVEGRVLEKGRGRTLQPGMGMGPDLLAKALHQPRFADTGLAHDRDHLTVALAHPLPTTHEQPQFVLAADERRQPTRGGRGFEPPTHPADPGYPIELYRLVDALERTRGTVFNREEAGDEPIGRGGYQYRAGSGGFLYSRGDIGHVAED